MNSETGPRSCGEIVVGDCLDVLRGLSSNTFQSCVTSPPYWGLRDYGVDGQIGAETTVDQYITKLTTVFREVRRTLTQDGTLWLNIGDSYTSGGRNRRQTDKKNPAREMAYRAPTPDGLKPKDLIGIPWKLAFALQADGWYLRCDVIWNKPNAQPESVRDRPTRTHEYLFLFAKSEHYLYDHEAIKEQAASRDGKRNCRSVWSVPTAALREAHFATFPPKLIEPCILASSRPGQTILDPFFGAGTVGMVASGLGRSFLGIELKPEYAEIARRRLKF